MEAELSVQGATWAPPGNQPSSEEKSDFSTVTSSVPLPAGDSAAQPVASSTSDGIGLLCTAGQVLAESVSTPSQPIPINTPRAPVASLQTRLYVSHYFVSYAKKKHKLIMNNET